MPPSSRMMAAISGFDFAIADEIDHGQSQDLPHGVLLTLVEAKFSTPACPSSFVRSDIPKFARDLLWTVWRALGSPTVQVGPRLSRGYSWGVQALMRAAWGDPVERATGGHHRNKPTVISCKIN